MPDLTISSAASYLADRLQIPVASIFVEELSGGVSSRVFRAIVPDLPALVLKQSLAKLRVREDWYSDRARIFREMDALQLLGPLVPAGSLPELLFTDRAEYLFAMSAAEADAPTWKQQLLAGETDLSLARQAAQLQAVFFRAEGLKDAFVGLEQFDELRLDPYYRHTSARHPDLQTHFDAAIEQSRTQLRALTHGDWSPKNFLINPGPRLFSIDYEVMHWGDPSFDTAFLLNHFLLKGWHCARHRANYAALGCAYWNHLLDFVPGASGWLPSATLRHLGCLHLARVDGKSPAEYLRPAEQASARRFARDLIQNPPASIPEVFEMQAEAFHE